jgi:hypothetical protein
VTDEAALPPGPVAVNVYVVVTAGLTTTVPFAPNEPIGAIVTAVAPVVAKVSVEEPPGGTVAVEAVSSAVGAAAGGAVTTTRVEEVVVPPGPVAVRVYVVVTLGLTTTVPFAPNEPIGVIVTAVALVVANVSVDEPPGETALLEAVSSAVGATAPGGGGGGAAVTAKPPRSVAERLFGSVKTTSRGPTAAPGVTAMTAVAEVDEITLQAALIPAPNEQPAPGTNPVPVSAIVPDPPCRALAGVTATSTGCVGGGVPITVNPAGTVAAWPSGFVRTTLRGPGAAAELMERSAVAAVGEVTLQAARIPAPKEHDAPGTRLLPAIVTTAEVLWTPLAGVTEEIDGTGSAAAQTDAVGPTGARETGAGSAGGKGASCPAPKGKKARTRDGAGTGTWLVGSRPENGNGTSGCGVDSQPPAGHPTGDRRRSASHGIPSKFSGVETRARSISKKLG